MKNALKAFGLALVFWVLMIGGALYGIDRQDRALQAEAVEAMGMGK